jgi:hypothetical protein
MPSRSGLASKTAGAEQIAVVLLLYCCFTAALLLLYCCFTAALLPLTAALLLLYCCFTAALLLLYSCFTAAYSCFTAGPWLPTSALSWPPTSRYSFYLLYWYKSTNTGVEGNTGIVLLVQKYKYWRKLLGSPANVQVG